MIVALIVSLVVGVIAGAVSDELLRGRDPRSRWVVAAGVGGAVAGLISRQAIGGDGLLVDLLTALLGALVLACAVRVKTSAVIARADWTP